MKNTFLKLPLIAFLFIFVSSCSKEHRIERNLRTKGGDWSISRYIYTYGSYNPAINGGNDPQLYSFDNCGKFHFSKDGSGTATISIDGETETFSFKYSNTKDDLTLTYTDGQSQVYQLRDWSRGAFTMASEKTTYDPDGYQEVDNESFVLKKD